MTSEFVLTIEGMTCGGCSARLTKVMMGRPGVISALISHESGQGLIQTDHSVKESDLREIINLAGFSVKEV